MTTHHHTSHTDAHTFTSHKAKTQEWHKHKHADDMNTGQQEHTRRSRRRPHHHTTAQSHTNTRTMLTDAKRQHSMHTCRTWHAQQNRPHNTTQHTHTHTHTTHTHTPQRKPNLNATMQQRQQSRSAQAIKHHQGCARTRKYNHNCANSDTQKRKCKTCSQESTWPEAPF